MSYHELADFADLMAELGFGTPLSVDSFRRPSFHLMANCLHFLVNSIAPEAGLALEISSPEDRAYFVTTAVSLALSKAHVRLNPRRLYQSDALAARELRKLALEIVECMGTVSLAGGSAQSSPAAQSAEAAVDLSAHAASLRQAASELLEKSTKLLVRLRTDAEATLSALNAAASLHPDPTALSQAVQRRIETLESDASRLSDDLSTTRREKIALEEQVKQKSGDISRLRDRLEVLRAKQPAFLSELEEKENELAALHAEYARKYRSLAFLQAQLQKSDLLEREHAQNRERAIQQMQRGAERKKTTDLAYGADGAVGMDILAQEMMETPSPAAAASLRRGIDARAESDGTAESGDRGDRGGRGKRDRRDGGAGRELERERDIPIVAEGIPDDEVRDGGSIEEGEEEYTYEDEDVEESERDHATDHVTDRLADQAEDRGEGEAPAGYEEQRRRNLAHRAADAGADDAEGSVDSEEVYETDPKGGVAEPDYAVGGMEDEGYVDGDELGGFGGEDLNVFGDEGNQGGFGGEEYVA